MYKINKRAFWLFCYIRKYNALNLKDGTSKIYTVSNPYLDYLRQYDNKVSQKKAEFIMEFYYQITIQNIVFHLQVHVKKETPY